MKLSKINWKEEKETLQKYILEDKLSYELIGRMYGCTGNNIKKQAKQLGIELPQRRKVNPCETFNKNRVKTVNYCLYCNKEIPSYQKYCSNRCLVDYEYSKTVEKWKDGEISGTIKHGGMSGFIRRYLFEKYNGECLKCHWHEINPFTGNVPLHVHHIDGNCTNNKEENLLLLCPNCHSLTENFGSLNKDSKRYYYKRT